jgi:hypothetical protein
MHLGRISSLLLLFVTNTIRPEDLRLSMAWPCSRTSGRSHEYVTWWTEGIQEVYTFTKDYIAWDVFHLDRSCVLNSNSILILVTWRRNLHAVRYDYLYLGLLILRRILSRFQIFKVQWRNLKDCLLPLV